ncbi:MAG TPA: aspartate aminotransferase family protein [Candidatus Binatia bacterium]|nr:aspartate aminotransferase family protein [Candidatus Binatia bacterium]
MSDRPELMRDEALRTAFFRHVCQTSPEPLGLVVARAAGATVWDAHGRAYLDLLSGIGVANVGHCHPDVVRAVQEQAARYLHVMVYGEAIQAPQVELARQLAALTPGDLDVVFFTNSGAEAVEGALKTARKFTGRRGFIAFNGSFHGDTFGALSVGGNPVYRRPFEPLLSDVRFLSFDDVNAVAQIDNSTAAVIVEPIQGEGGVRVPHDEFLPALRRRCTEVGALLIFDEVITGFGRSGRVFACEHWAVTPDILVVAKALGGGMPLGAFIGRRALMETLSHDPPLAHVTTFGGHPVSCAAGLAALNVLVREQLAARAAQLGEQWRAHLSQHLGERLRDVRGKGLLIGLEFVDADATQRFARACFARGLIVNWTLHRDTVIRLAPPLVITDEESQSALARLSESLGSLTP